MPTEKFTWGGLTTQVVHGLKAGERPSLAVVLCHGYGAPGTDLVGLARPLLDAEAAGDRRAVYLFPAAPLDLSAQGLPGGRAWWPIDLNQLLNLPTSEMLAALRAACPPGLPEVRKQMVTLLGAAAKHFDLPAERFVLGGFSQGAMLATDVALRLKGRPAALCIMSGALIDEAEWRRLAAERGPLVVLQSHGQHDSVLPFASGTALRDLLLAAGIDLDFVAFAGDHEIPPVVIERLAELIRRFSR